MKSLLNHLSLAVALGFCLATHSLYALSDGNGRDLVAIGSPIRPAPADPEIARALQQISSRQIQHTIETLVSFHTRNTLSSMT